MSERYVSRTAMAIVCVLVSYVIVAAQTPAANTDPRTGTWNVNLQKSQFPAGTPAPKMLVRQYASRPDGFIVMTQSGVNAQNNPVFNQTTYRIDGKEYPEYTQATLAEFSAKGTKPTNMSPSFKLVDAYTVEGLRKDTTGKVTEIWTQVVSKDGKTLTHTVKDGNGKVLATTVWDKQ